MEYSTPSEFESPQGDFRCLTLHSTPEIFPAPNRGTGTGIASFVNRISGLCAPIVAVAASGTNPVSCSEWGLPNIGLMNLLQNAPVYAAGSLILAAFVAMCLFPIETRGKQSL